MFDCLSQEGARDQAPNGLAYRSGVLQCMKHATSFTCHILKFMPAMQCCIDTCCVHNTCVAYDTQKLLSAIAPCAACDRTITGTADMQCAVLSSAASQSACFACMPPFDGVAYGLLHNAGVADHEAGFDHTHCGFAVGHQHLSWLLKCTPAAAARRSSSC
jgi:hypothetical protein